MSLFLSKKSTAALIAFILIVSSIASVFVGPRAAAVRTYDFKDNENNKAYEGADTAKPPRDLEIGTEIGPASYLSISRLDGKVAQFSFGMSGQGPGLLPSEYHRFRFKIFEPPTALSQIYVEHDGYGDSRQPGLQLFIWNYNTSSWQYLASHGCRYCIGVANATISKDLSNYIDTEGYLNLLAQTKANVGSCPFLYSYDGEKYVFVADMYNRGILSVPGFRPQPEDYVKIESDQLRPTDGFYRVQITQEYDEISYLDKVALIAVDHAPGVEVYPSLLKVDAGNIYAVGKTLMPPVSAADRDGKSVLQNIVGKDGIYTSGAQNKLNILDLNLGNLSAARQIKLVISAYTNWDNDQVPKSDEEQNQIGRFIQVKDKNGSWATVFKDFEIMAPAGSPRTYVLDMTGKFLTNDYSVRIGYYPDVRFDYVGIDTTAPQEITAKTVPPLHADLHFRGYSELSGSPSIPEYYRLAQDSPFGYSRPVGNFTRFGEVSPLLADRDDEFVILHHGDEISVKFQYLPMQEGTQRDFFLYSWGYHKGRDYATGNTVEPLPFYRMSSYPYPGNESYPSDNDHLAYLKMYNTREYGDQGQDSGPSKHRTIYTDYVKVDVSAVELSTTRVAETSTTSVVETSTTNVEVVNNVGTLVPYLALVGLAAIVVFFFAIRRIRKRQPRQK
jgi:hypothetical protein